jgi:outer membrane cobalamin receptor
VLNASLIRSRVELDLEDPQNKGFALTGRPLQGQSPYVVNLGYVLPGRRQPLAGISAVQSHRPPHYVRRRPELNYSIFEMPRHTVDLAVTKGFGQHLEVRAGIQNMLNPEYRFLYDFDRNGRINGVETGRPLPATSAALTHSGPHLRF